MKSYPFPQLLSHVSAAANMSKDFESSDFDPMLVLYDPGWRPPVSVKPLEHLSKALRLFPATARQELLAHLQAKEGTTTTPAPPAPLPSPRSTGSTAVGSTSSSLAPSSASTMGGNLPTAETTFEAALQRNVVLLGIKGEAAAPVKKAYKIDRRVRMEDWENPLDGLALSFEHGPLALVRRCWERKLPVTIYVRHTTGMRSKICHCNIMGFDRHCNMLVANGVEVWGSKNMEQHDAKKKEKETSGSSSIIVPPDNDASVPSIRPHKLTILRGDCVILVHVET